MNEPPITLHVVSHTHWDREWYLTFQQFRLKLVHLVDNLLDLLDHDPNFRSFMLDGQTIILDDYLHMRPEREADLRRLVREGRISIGPWCVLPDEFLVSPEAILRNLLQGERTARVFGPKMMVGYNPDTFGHIGQLPQIFRGFGFDSACVQRGLSDEPCEFWWQSPDGSRVFMAYLRDSYGNAADLPVSHPDQMAAKSLALRDSLLPHSSASHLLLMWGTDHMEPPPGASAALDAAREKLGSQPLIHSTLANYIQAARASIRDLEHLPVIQGELRSPKRHALLPNVLSTRMWIKQRNQACQTLLELWAEPFSVWAEQAVPEAPLPPAYVCQPAAILRQAWRLLLENHPHDSICGCSIDAVADDMRPRFDQVEQISEKIVEQSLERLAGGIQTANEALRPSNSEKLIPIVVFNPTAGPRTDAIELTLELPPELAEFELVNETGAALPFRTGGLGTRELITMQMSRGDFRRMSGMVTDGNIEGLTLQEIQTRRDGEQVFIEIVLSDKFGASAAAWERAQSQLRPFLEDASVTTFHIHARSLSATKLAFSAPGVPGYGYRTFWLRSRAAAEARPVRLNSLVSALLPIGARLARLPLVQTIGSGLLALQARRSARKPNRIENEFFSVEAAADGTLTLTDRRSGETYSGLNSFEDSGDCGDEYNFAPPQSDTICTARLKQAQVEINPVSQTLVLSLELKIPAGLAESRKSRSEQQAILPITSRVTLTRGVPRLDIQTEVENNANDHRLRVVFPASFRVTTASFDGHFEVVERPVALPPFDETWVEQPRPEVPQRAFTDITDGKAGLVIANRGLPEVEVKQFSDTQGLRSGIALTLLRCVGWLSRDDFSTRNGHAGPFATLTPGAQMPGKWSFDYSIIPYSTERLAAWKQAYAFQAQLRAVVASVHAGALPGCGAFLQAQPAEFVISVVKTAEDNNGWLVRGYNLSDREISVTLKTWKRPRQVERANLAEESIRSLQPGEDGVISFTAKGHEIVTVMMR